MSISIQKEFVVEASLRAVWDLLTEPHRVVKCLPGAEITERLDDQTYLAKLTIHVGPIPASFKGEIRFEKRDVDNWTTELVGSGKQLAGTSTAEMRMKCTLAVRDAGSTEVSVHSVVTVKGLLAEFGQGVILQISDYLFDKFTRAVIVELETVGA